MTEKVWLKKNWILFDDTDLKIVTFSFALLLSTYVVVIGHCDCTGSSLDGSNS